MVSPTDAKGNLKNVIGGYAPVVVVILMKGKKEQTAIGKEAGSFRENRLSHILPSITSC